MRETIILGLLAALFAYLARIKTTRWGLKVAFALIFIFLALRYGFGNDYGVYLSEFEQQSQYELFDTSNNYHHFEPGWIYLSQLFRPVGFFGMTAVLALVNCVIYYYFIKKYVPVSYYWVAILLYVFSPELLLIQCSAMRQTVAILLFLVALRFLENKDPIRYFLCIALAAFFHATALTLLPIYLIVWVNWKPNIVFGAILAAAFAALVIFNAPVNQFVKYITGNYFEKYLHYEKEGVVTTGLGFVYAWGMILLLAGFGGSQQREVRLVVKLALIGFLLMPINIGADLFARVGFYFAPAAMVAYVVLLTNLKSLPIRIAFATVISIYTVWKLYRFLYQPDNLEHYLNYQTILSAHWWL